MKSPPRDPQSSESPEAPGETSVAPGIEIPGYRVERRVGVGGMASVYLAVQDLLERPVALKLLDAPETPGFAERFLQEGRIIASLSHPQVITIYDIGIVKGRPYIAMEYLEGGTLEQRIEAGMSPDQALAVLELIALCLDFVHRRGIVHRDVKPANILFRRDGTPVLTDFGIAKQIRTDARLTVTGSAVGSPYYLSPEQAEELPLDGRADIYSLGVVFYEMLTGEKPFAGDSYIQTIVKHLQEPVPLLPWRLRSYQLVLARMLAKDRERRFADAQALVRAVRALRSSRPGRGRLRPQWRALPDLSKPLAKVLPQWARGGVALVLVGLLLLGGALWGTVRVLRGPAPLEPAVALPEPAPSTLSPSSPDERVAAPPEGAGPQVPDPEPESVAALAEPAASGPSSPPSEPGPSPAPDPVPPGGAETQLPPAPMVPAQDRASPEPPGADPQGPARDQVAALTEGADAEELARQSEIDRLLALARDRAEDFALTTPAEDSALFYYQRVLALDPQNPAVEEGKSDIARRYAWLVEQQLARGDYARARAYADRGLQVRPGDPDLLALRDSIPRRAAASRRPARLQEPPPSPGLFDRIRGGFEGLFRRLRPGAGE